MRKPRSPRGPTGAAPGARRSGAVCRRPPRARLHARRVWLAAVCGAAARSPLHALTSLLWSAWASALRAPASVPYTPQPACPGAAGAGASSASSACNPRAGTQLPLPALPSTCSSAVLRSRYICRWRRRGYSSRRRAAPSRRAATLSRHRLPPRRCAALRLLSRGLPFGASPLRAVCSV